MYLIFSSKLAQIYPMQVYDEHHNRHIHVAVQLPRRGAGGCCAAGQYQPGSQGHAGADPPPIHQVTGCEERIQACPQD